MAEAAVVDISAYRCEAVRARVDHVDADVEGVIRLEGDGWVACVAGAPITDPVQDL
jgi:hypothetical protein